MRRRNTITRRFIQLSVFLFLPHTVQSETIMARCMCTVYSHAFKSIRERKTHSNTIKTQVTRLLLKRVDVSCGYNWHPSEFKCIIHLSFYRFKAVGVYSNVNTSLPRLLLLIKQKQVAFQDLSLELRSCFLNENALRRTS